MNEGYLYFCKDEEKKRCKLDDKTAKNGRFYNKQRLEQIALIIHSICQNKKKNLSKEDNVPICHLMIHLYPSLLRKKKSD